MYSCAGADIMLGMPPGMHFAWSAKLPCPLLAWSAMLSSWIFWYSGVSGACCAGPNALVGSNFTPCPPRRGLIASHWPFQLGYFASLAARAPPIVIISAAASTNVPVELRYNMIFLPAFSDSFLMAMDATFSSNRIYHLHRTWNGAMIPG